MAFQVMPGCDPAEVARLADDARRAVEALFRAVGRYMDVEVRL